MSGKRWESGGSVCGLGRYGQTACCSLLVVKAHRTSDVFGLLVFLQLLQHVIFHSFFTVFPGVFGDIMMISKSYRCCAFCAAAFLLRCAGGYRSTIRTSSETRKYFISPWGMFGFSLPSTLNQNHGARVRVHVCVAS